MAKQVHVGANAPKQKISKSQPTPVGGMIAVIRIRGSAGVSGKIAQTLAMLRLHKSNHLVVVKNDRSMRKMVEKVKDFVTYGDITQDKLTALIEKRGLAEGNHRLTPEVLKQIKLTSIEEISKDLYSGKKKLVEMGLEPVFRLNPPKKGHERGGVKKPYKLGGALGNRGADINELITRMM